MHKEFDLSDEFLFLILRSGDDGVLKKMFNSNLLHFFD